MQPVFHNLYYINYSFLYFILVICHEMTKKRHEMHYFSLLSPTIRPSLIVIILSVILAIPSSWVTMITVFPDLLISLRSSNTSCPVFWSSAPVGSSASMISALVTKALAIATLCSCSIAGEPLFL